MVLSLGCVAWIQYLAYWCYPDDTFASWPGHCVALQPLPVHPLSCRPIRRVVPVPSCLLLDFLPPAWNVTNQDVGDRRRDKCGIKKKEKKREVKECPSSGGRRGSNGDPSSCLSPPWWATETGARSCRSPVIFDATNSPLIEEQQVKIAWRGPVDEASLSVV